MIYAPEKIKLMKCDNYLIDFFWLRNNKQNCCCDIFDYKALHQILRDEQDSFTKKIAPDDEALFRKI